MKNTRVTRVTRYIYLRGEVGGGAADWGLLVELLLVLGQTKVHHQHLGGVSVVIKQDVLRLQISVDYSPGVKVMNRLQDLYIWSEG